MRLTTRLLLGYACRERETGSKSIKQKTNPGQNFHWGVRRLSPPSLFQYGSFTPVVKMLIKNALKNSTMLDYLTSEMDCLLLGSCQAVWKIEEVNNPLMRIGQLSSHSSENFS